MDARALAGRVEYVNVHAFTGPPKYNDMPPYELDSTTLPDGFVDAVQRVVFSSLFRASILNGG
ncbi:MAG: hypothetical protein M1818_007434 [Claussenomyces sp. TS43310]|nr:MAG: hypothetical protein M1818_007434 [Claussenomyces sp. TS43310]